MPDLAKEVYALAELEDDGRNRAGYVLSAFIVLAVENEISTAEAILMLCGMWRGIEKIVREMKQHQPKAAEHA